METSVQAAPAPSGEATTGGPGVAEADKFFDQERAACLLQGLSALYENKQFMDITLVVGDQEFRCHKTVLAISSPYFLAMFSSDMMESQEGCVQLQEMAPKTVQLILDYIYTGEVVFSEDTVQNLLSAANMFQLIQLRDGCAQYMVRHVGVSNCIGVYFFARAHQCEVLAARAKELINQQFETLWQEKEFLELPVDKVVEILKDDSVNVAKEEMVYDGAMGWLHANFDERSNSETLAQLLRSVRLANISAYVFCDNIDAVHAFKSCEPVAKMINTVKYYHMLKNRKAEMDLNYLPRKGMGYERGIVIIANPYSDDNHRKFNTMDLLLPKTGEIRHLCKLPQSLYMPGACVTGDDQIYLAGGAIRKVNYRGPSMTEGVSSNLFLFDKSFGSWQVKAKMHYGRSQFCLVMVDSFIYAIGGQNETCVMESVERYDISTNSWRVIASLPKKLRCTAACSHRGKLYVIGGETEAEIVKTAFRYCPTFDNWVELPSMHCPRTLAGCAVFKDKVYVVGGNSAVSSKWKKEFVPEHCISSVEVFDPEAGSWSFGPELPNALCGASVVKYGDTILAVGGEDDKSWMAGLFTLREEGSKEFWVEGQELPVVLSTFACVVANIPKELFRDRDEL